MRLGEAMITLEEALAAQADLVRLCQERPLLTNEIFQPNAFYGIDQVLKDYAGLSADYLLKTIVPHGIYLDDNFLWIEEQQAKLPVVLVYPLYRERTYQAATTKKTVLIASPFVYVTELLKCQPKPERRGTLFFPSHSTHHITAQMDFERLADSITALGEEYQPVTVCMYWRDYNLGHHEPFRRKGIRIVSAGHMFDPAFLFRFYHLCSMHRYACGNDVGSHMFYAVKAGCSYFHLSGAPVSLAADKAILERDGGEAPASRLEYLMSLFRNPSPNPTQEQLKIVDYYLGAAYRKSPNGLRRDFLYAEALDRFGFSLRREGGGIRVVSPQKYLRCPASRPDRILRRKIGSLVGASSLLGRNKA
jgi:hypothetical protein